MKMPSLIKRKKLRAATARRSRSLGLPDEMDYEQMAEPNMKLSRALLIVLVLHIVAVAGIIAFNTIKTRETMSTPAPEATGAEPVAATLAASATLSSPAAPAQPNDEITRVTDASVAKTSAKKPMEKTKPVVTTPSVPDSGKIYTVVKGDNPVTIARHLHVPYDALLELNQITDPRKLQIGQKLHLPAATTAAKTK